MNEQVIILGLGLILVGFLIGRWTAPRERNTVVYTPPRPRAGDATLGGGEADAEIEAILRAGNKIEAIKRYREAYGTGLKDAKDAVDALDRRLGR